MEVGDILLFHRNPKDKVASFLSWLLQRFEPSYTREFWHTAPVTKVEEEGCYVLDAQKGGAVENFYSFGYIKKNCKVFHWLQELPDQVAVDQFVEEYIGTTYDFGAYFGTVFFYLLSRIIGKSYRIHDQELHCWELTSLFCRVMGKELQPIYEYPLISNMLRILKRNEGGIT